MVALRKRQTPATPAQAEPYISESSPPSNPPNPGPGATAGAVAEQGGEAAAPASSDSDLRKRLEELRRSEELQRQHAHEFRAQLAAQLKPDGPQQQQSAADPIDAALVAYLIVQSNGFVRTRIT